MVKIRMAFRTTGGIGGSGSGNETLGVIVDLDPRGGGKRGSGGGRVGGGDGGMNVSNFGDFEDQGGATGPIGGLLIEPVLLLNSEDITANNGTFAIPFSLEPDNEIGGGAGGVGGALGVDGWIVEEEDDEEEAEARKPMRRSRKMQDTEAMAAVNQTLDSDGSVLRGASTRSVSQEAEESEWAAFDPDAEDLPPNPADKDEDEDPEENQHAINPEEGQQAFNPEEDQHDLNPEEENALTMDDNTVNRTRDSTISEVELVRGADDDLSAQSGRPSVLESTRISTASNDLGQPSIVNESPEVPPQDNNDISALAFDDDVGGIPPVPVAPESVEPQDSTLVSPQSSHEEIDKSLTIGGLDADLEEEQQQLIQTPKKRQPRKRRESVGPKRRRKRRRVAIDNDMTELSSEHIKNMLRDTSNIVLEHRVHPADYVADAEDDDAVSYVQRPWKLRRGEATSAISTLSYERLLARPNIADDGALASQLLNLWIRNASRLEGKPFPYEMRGEAGVEQLQEREEERDLALEEEVKISEDEPEDELEDVEIVRQNDEYNAEADISRLSTDISQIVKDNEIEEEIPLPQESDEEIPIPMEEEDFGMPIQDEEMNVMENQPGIGSPTQSEDGSVFSLGAVNDIEQDLQDQPRQEQGDELISSTTKWHKHTVKVLTMLQNNMTSGEENEDEGEEKATQLSYDKLSYGISRRTACGVFFELLQLKTWDFIDLDQDKSYADIKITPGLRFDEHAPTN